MEYRKNIIDNINYVTSALESNGFFVSSNNTLNRHAKLKNFVIGIDMIEDDKEFTKTINLWIDYIYEFILLNIKNKKILIEISQKYMRYNWIEKFLVINNIINP